MSRGRIADCDVHVVVSITLIQAASASLATPLIALRGMRANSGVEKLHFFDMVISAVNGAKSFLPGSGCVIS